MDNNNPLKFELTRNVETPLRMFFFTVQNGGAYIKMPLDVQAIIAYDILSAFHTMRKNYPKGTKIFVTQKGNVVIKDILNILNTQEQNSNPIPVVVEPPKVKVEEAVTKPVTPPKQVETKQQFINNCMLIADQFVTNKRDRESFKRILGKIKPDESIKVPAQA